ncbi:hypothetical protein [Rhodococcoides yunnanense]|uniref:hypothetical protein n=1 Tax=Rhodococcoides yunnanense TaxID=278209 RepID=UPI0009341CA4|nr:hypothetical protein [Rhodococcus yunnanensis]
MADAFMPGSVLADRYRLLEPRPAEHVSTSWLARDLTTGREIGLAVVGVEELRSKDPRTDATERFASASGARPRVIMDPPRVLLLARPTRTGVAPIVPRSGELDGDGMSGTARSLWVLAAVVALAFFGSAGWVISTTMFGGGVQNVSVPSLSSRQETETPKPKTLAPSDAEVWSAVRYPDNADDAQRAIDANPATRWSTDSYRSAFGSSADGIGLIVDFGRAVDIDDVWIASSDSGTAVEIRTPPGEDRELDSTRLLGSATLQPGTTHIPVDSESGVRSILVWIAELAATDSGFQSTVSEVGATAAAE